MHLVTVIVVFVTLYVYALTLVSMRTKGGEERGGEDLFFVLLVPALNEEQVIGRTVSSLSNLRGNFLAMVIDDDSDDGTVEAVVPLLDDPRIRLLKQPPERARRGKGHVLNSGYAALWGLQVPEDGDRSLRKSHEQPLGLVERYGAKNIVVVVFDSDARVQPDFLETVAPLFEDPDVAGVQSAVRMYNADQNVLTLWQHLEFAIWGQLFCFAKNRLGSATLGGNGQCVRLSALEALGDEPWQSSSLTEDLDMSLRLWINGWRMRFCPSAAVWQEAVPKLRALVRQRSRWLQGHFVCWQYLPAVWRSARPLGARLDLTLFLLLPAVFLPIGLASIFSWVIFLLGIYWDLAGLLAWYVLAFPMAPLVMLAWRRTDRPPLLRLVLHGHLFVFYSFVWFMAGLVVYWHVLVGRRAWAKTSRVRGPAVPHEVVVVPSGERG